MPHGGVAFDEFGGGAELGVEFAGGPGVGRLQHRGGRRRRAMLAGQHAVAGDGDDLGLGVAPPDRGGGVQGRQSGPHQQHRGPGGKVLQRRRVPRVVPHRAVDRFASMEQQRPRPRRTGGQDQDVGQQAFAGRQGDRPALVGLLRRAGARVHHPGDAKARRAVLKVAKALFQIVAEQATGREVLLVPALRPRRIGFEPVQEARGRAAVQRHVADAGVEQILVRARAVGQAASRLGIDERHIQAREGPHQGVGQQHAGRAGADDGDVELGALAHQSLPFQKALS